MDLVNQLSQAVTGCNNTSRQYGVGKATVLLKFENLSYLESIKAYVSRCHCYTCYMYYAVLAIFLAGEKALVFLFGVKPVIGLDALRH